MLTGLSRPFARRQTVRRDNCRLVQSVIETCLHKMLIDRDVKGAQESVAPLFSHSATTRNLTLVFAPSGTPSR